MQKDDTSKTSKKDAFDFIASYSTSLFSHPGYPHITLSPQTCSALTRPSLRRMPFDKVCEKKEAPEPAVDTVSSGAVCDKKVQQPFMARRTAMRMEKYLLLGVSARLVMMTGQEAPHTTDALVLPAI